MRRARSAHEVTLLLQAWCDGDKEALDCLAPLIYRELHTLAEHFMNCERPGHTLQATPLVNEAYLRLVDIQQANWQNRAHFFAICARAMRQILADHARSQGSMTRGGRQQLPRLEEALVMEKFPRSCLLELDGDLKQLVALDQRKSRVIELSFFGGLSVEETAEALRISSETVMHDWKIARAWLHRELGGGRRNGA